MQQLAKLTTAFFSSGHPLKMGDRLSDVDMRERQSGSVSMWDEALATSMCDDTARMLLDHWGPRWK